jgi:hypothetical protein
MNIAQPECYKLTHIALNSYNVLEVIFKFVDMSVLILCNFFIF